MEDNITSGIVEPTKPPIDKTVLWLVVATAIGLILWFMPAMAGLSVTGQHALAVVLFTVLLWVTGAVPTGVGSLLMIGLVLCFIPDVKPSDFLSFWTQDTMWFILVCFLFSAIQEVSGLAKRLTVYVFSLRTLIAIDFALLALNIIFSIAGMNSGFPKITLLFPLITTFAAMSGMPKDDPYVRHLALMINILANTSGMVVYSGFVLNPALGPLGGFSMSYATWTEWFFVPAFVYTMVNFVVVYFLFLPPRGEHFDYKIARAEVSKLGPVTKIEIKTIAWLVFAIILWVTGDYTGMKTGFAAVLVAGLVMLPGIGVISFKEFVQKTDWNGVFMLMGVFAIGTLGSTGFAAWIWDHILPAHISDNHMVSLTVISFLVELLHIPLGSGSTTQALAVPSLAAYGPAIGVSNILTSLVTYISIIGQAFFPYQNAVLIVGLAYGLWTAKDLFKLGIVMFFLTPLTLGVILYPWYLYMGWIK